MFMNICQEQPGQKAGTQSRESNVHPHHDRPIAMTFHRLSIYILVYLTLYSVIFVFTLPTAWLVSAENGL
jgi:hypothetical protein